MLGSHQNGKQSDNPCPIWGYTDIGTAGGLTEPTLLVQLSMWNVASLYLSCFGQVSEP